MAVKHFNKIFKTLTSLLGAIALASCGMAFAQTAALQQTQAQGQSSRQDKNVTTATRPTPAQQAPFAPKQVSAQTTPTQERAQSSGAPLPPDSTRQRLKQNDDLQGPFFLVDESPIQVIKILESLSGQIALQSPQLPDVKINFATSGKLPRSEAILAFKSLLAVNGIAITPMGEKFFKAAPAQGVNTQAPTYLFGKASELPASQYFYAKLYELNYIDIDSFKDTLTPFISPNGIATLTIFQRSNAFMLTDTLVNHQRIEMLLEKLDVAPDIGEEIKFFVLKNMSSEDMKRRLMTLQSDLLKKYLDKTTIESDERTNQVIVVTRKGNMKYIQDIIDKLDIDSEPLTRSEVYYIKYGEAKDVASVLNQIVKGQQAAVKSAQTSKTNAAAQANRTNRVINAQNASSGNATKLPTNLTADQTGASLQFSEYITIVPDERSNSIVCYGTPTDLKQISTIIDKVDVVLAQVKIDVIITEVTLSDKQVSGLSSFGLDYTTIKTDNKKGWSGSTSTYSVTDGDTPAFSLSMSEYGFTSVFNVAQQNNLVKILSAPSIVTTHNKEASVTVSQQYPLITGSTTYSAAVTPTTSSTIDWRDIGIELTVTPLIGENGVIQMKIKQTVSTVVDHTVIDSNTQPIIGKREAESFVSSASGDTVVLAGLQQSNTTDTNGAVWLLSDIPLIGQIFEPERQSVERTELIFFIRPTVIKSAPYSKVLTEEGMDSSRSRKELENYFTTGRFHDIKNDNSGKFEQTALERTLMPNRESKKISPKEEKPETKGEKSNQTDQSNTTIKEQKPDAAESSDKPEPEKSATKKKISAPKFRK